MQAIKMPIKDDRHFLFVDKVIVAMSNGVYN